MKKSIIILILYLVSFIIKSEDKKFAIIIPSYKNSLYYRKNLDSAICQKYDRSKFRIVYIDDSSGWEDNTAGFVESYIKEKNLENLITLRKNRIRRGAMANLWSEISLCDPDEIVVMLDGDDSLKDENVLSHLNEVYQQDIWLTYGQYECDPIVHGIGFAADYPEEIIKNRDFRNNFLATHLRTFYAWVFQNIKLEDFIYDNAFLSMTWDVAIMFPALEMCGNKFKFISKILYKYNMNNPISDYKTDPTLMFFLADYYKTKKPKYPLLKQPKYIPSFNRYNDPAAVGFIYGIDKYLSPGFDINIKDFKGRTALIQAIKFGLQSLIEFLVSQGADINCTDYDGLTPLMYAVIFTNLETVKYLIENGADITKFNNFGYNALEYAKKHNKTDITQLIQSITQTKRKLKLYDVEEKENEPIDIQTVEDHITITLNKYKDFLDKGTYQEKQNSYKLDLLPKSRYYTFKKAFEHFKDKKGKIIVELGTTKSFVNNDLPGYNNEDITYWDPYKSENWDWSSGFFTRLTAESLKHLNPKIHTVDLVESHIKICKTITKPYSNFIEYHNKSSLQFLSEFQQKSIDLLYIDTGDSSSLEPSMFLQLEEAKIIVEKDLISDEGLILIDDVKDLTTNNFNYKLNFGKSKFSIPHLLRNGFEILENEYQVLLRKKSNA